MAALAGVEHLDLSNVDLKKLTPEERADVDRLLGRFDKAERLDEFIRRVTPTKPPAPHMLPILDLFERARRAPIRAAISMPPRHGKSESLFNGLAWWMANVPADTHAYLSYSDDQATSQSRKIRQRAQEGGVALSAEMANLSEWRTTSGGGLFASGVGGALTGKGISGAAVVDDPFKDRKTADSRRTRDSVWEWFTSVVMSRLENASVFVVHCLAEGEPVLMADGTWRAVEHVRTGESVAAYDRGSFVERVVLGQRCSGGDQTLVVKTARKSLRVNAKHPFLLEDRTWRQAGDLRVGDRVVVCHAAYGREEWAEPDFAWLIGFMMGDGWVTRWKRRNRDKKRGRIYESESLCVCIAKSVYPALNDRAISLLARYFGRLPRLTKHGYYRLDSNGAGRRLIELGIVGGAHGKRIPDWVFRLAPEAKVAFLRGYADADGAVLRRNTDSVRISSVSADLIEDTRRLAISAGVRCGRLSTWRANVRAPHSKLATPYECHSVSVNFSAPPDQVEAITAVIAAEPARVYDLAVDGAENFVAGGFVVHNTRWHEDDLIGRLRKEGGWEILNFPAIAEPGDPLGRAPGTPLWPDVRPLSMLAEQRALDAYNFEALFQGRPRPRGSAVFQRDPPRFDLGSFDLTGWRIMLAGDPAATDDTSNDYGALVALAVRGSGASQEGRVLDVFRKQVTVPDYADEAMRFQEKHGGGLIGIEAVGGFKAVPQMMRRVRPSIRIQEIRPIGDKFTRAQPVATAWNEGRIMVPYAASWVQDFLDEVLVFTGVKDANDDQVDALAHAWNMAGDAPTYVRRTSPTFTRRR